MDLHVLCPWHAIGFAGIPLVPGHLIIWFLKGNVKYNPSPVFTVQKYRFFAWFYMNLKSQWSFWLIFWQNYKSAIAFISWYKPEPKPNKIAFKPMLTYFPFFSLSCRYPLRNVPADPVHRSNRNKNCKKFNIYWMKIRAGSDHILSEQPVDKFCILC